MDPRIARAGFRARHEEVPYERLLASLVMRSRNSALHHARRRWTDASSNTHLEAFGK